MKRLICLFLACTLSTSSASHAAEIRTVALSGQQMPGLPDGTVFGSFFNRPVLNDAGQTAFLHGNVWSEGSGSLALAAAHGQQAPGMPDGVTYGYFSDERRIVINDAGLTAFSATTSISDVIHGIWTSGPGGEALVALTGEQAAGTPPGVFYNLEFLGERSFLLNEAGQVAFRSYLTGGGEEIWAQRHGNVELVARHGSHTSGTPDGVNFRDFTLEGPVFNRLGQTALVGALTGSGVDTTNDSGIWSEGSGSLELIAREGSQAPGMPDAVVFVALRSGPPAFTMPALNKAGQTAFVSRVTGGGLTAASGIWMGTAGNLLLVASRADQPPGTSSGVNFGTLIRPILNDAGQLAFFCHNDGSKTLAFRRIL